MPLESAKSQPHWRNDLKVFEFQMQNGSDPIADWPILGHGRI